MKLDSDLDLIIKKKVENMKGKYCMVRCYKAGVFAGIIEEIDGQKVTMKDARRIWYWEGAASLSQLAMEGTKKPTECKFPCEVSNVTLFEVQEIIICTDAARKSIKSVPVWEAK
jgi:hypothetical protein